MQLCDSLTGRECHVGTVASSLIVTDILNVYSKQETHLLVFTFARLFYLVYQTLDMYHQFRDTPSLTHTRTTNT